MAGPNPHEIPANLARVHERIDAACARAGRSSDQITLVAVTKRISLDKVVSACQAGQYDLGENRIQEAIPRQSTLATALENAGLCADNLRWHFIGHLQSNKAGKAFGAFHLIHAVDSLRLMEKLDQKGDGVEQPQSVLVEVNVTGETQKHGVAPEAALSLVENLAASAHLEPLGLMTMARYGSDETELHRTFAQLRQLNESARERTGLSLPHLSMGMSHDFEVAIAEGATILRVGTAIFGPREPA